MHAKKSLVAVFIFFISAQASAALLTNPENCWQAGIGRVPGHFKVNVDAAALTTDELLQTLSRFSINTNVSATAFPLVTTEQRYIGFEIAPSGVWTVYNKDGTVAHEPEADVEARVNAEVRLLAALPGVTSIDCAQHAYPEPRETESD